jgi:6,7-dimethyl-8-ribityllumazine synthase
MLPRKLNKVRSPLGRNLRIAIVASCYNAELVDTLLRHTLATLSENGVRSMKIARVPGSYEIPVVAAKLARSKKYHAIITLGVVLQGKTSHAEHITLACTIHLQKIAIETGVPVVHQILSPRNLKDARARVRIRGIEAAQTAIQMAHVIKEV